MCLCVKAEQQVPVAAVAAMREPSGSACVESGTTVALTVTDCTISRRDCGRLQIVFDCIALSHFVPHVSQACHFLCWFYAAELPSVPCGCQGSAGWRAFFSGSDGGSISLISCSKACAGRKFQSAFKHWRSAAVKL